MIINTPNATYCGRDTFRRSTAIDHEKPF